MAHFRNTSRVSGNTYAQHDVVPYPILLVEDSKTVATVLKNTIAKKWQCEVHLAYTYQQAKEFLKAHRTDYFLVICELNLPDAPDGEILELVALAKLKSIVITGKFGEDFKKQMSAKSVVDYLLKDSHNAFEYVADQVGRLYRNQFVHMLVVDDSSVSRT